MTSSTEPAAEVPSKTERLVSIDALRGFDMFWIIGGDALAISVLEAGNWSFSNRLADQFRHVEWEGFRFYDLIFPLFLFLVGCVLPFSLAKYRADPRATYGRIIRRTLLLILLGLLCNNLLQFDWENMRYAGVLQRIGIGYGVAAILYLKLGLTIRCFLVAGILLGYWAMLSWIPGVDGAIGDLSRYRNLAGYIDSIWLPGKIYEEYYGFGDNEGILSTLPAIATAMIGVFTGEWLRTSNQSWMKAFGLVLAGFFCLAVGYAWGQYFPIIKNLWTSSFVLVAAGWSLMLLSIFYTLIDVLGWRSWCWFWVVIGMNAITIYVMREFVDFDRISRFFLGGIIQFTSVWQHAILALGILAAEWLVLYHLYRQKIFLRV